MKAALITEIASPYQIGEVAIDRPLGREVLVEVKASGLCHSDMHIAANDFGLPVPLLLGHEVAGVVTEVGPDVTSVAVGDHVAACVVASCGMCAQCRVGHATACLRPDSLQRPTGSPLAVSYQGAPLGLIAGVSGFAEYTLTHENQLAVIPKDIPFDRAALLGCGVVTGAGAVLNSARVQFGETVAVIGCGGVGLNAVQAAALAGASQVIAIDLQTSKLDLAKKFGATDVVNPADGDTVEQVRALTGGFGVDHAFEVTGLQFTLKQALDMIGHFGTAYIIGMQKPGATVDVTIDPMNPLALSPREAGLRGVNMGSVNPKRDIARFAKLYLQGRFNLDDLVSRTIDIGDINKGYEELKSGAIARTVITSFNAATVI